MLLSVYLSIYLSTYLPIYLSIYLSKPHRYVMSAPLNSRAPLKERNESETPRPKPLKRTQEPETTEYPKAVGGSWVVVCGAISQVAIVITHMRGPTTILITTLKP